VRAEPREHGLGDPRVAGRELRAVRQQLDARVGRPDDPHPGVGVSWGRRCRRRGSDGDRQPRRTRAEQLDRHHPGRAGRDRQPVGHCQNPPAAPAGSRRRRRRRRNAGAPCRSSSGPTVSRAGSSAGASTAAAAGRCSEVERDVRLAAGWTAAAGPAAVTTTSARAAPMTATSPARRRAGTARRTRVGSWVRASGRNRTTHRTKVRRPFVGRALPAIALDRPDVPRGTNGGQCPPYNAAARRVRVARPGGWGSHVEHRAGYFPAGSIVTVSPLLVNCSW
jgi:hypothetical protein